MHFDQLIVNIYILVIGASLGSFINCMALRLPLGQSLLGRSQCPNCRHKLAATDLVPLLSFFWLRGRCRYCRAPISLLYPAIELTTAFLVLLFVQRLNYYLNLQSVAILTSILVLIAITVSDLFYQQIPDEFLVFFMSLGFLLHSPLLISYLGGAILMTFLFWLINHFSYGTAMGFADVKYIFVIGLLLPLPYLLLAVYLAFLTGGITSVILILTRYKKMKSQIAFGPFLSIGVLTSLWLLL